MTTETSTDIADFWHFATTWEVIADDVPERIALIGDQGKVSWREFDDRAARLATLLDEHGVGPGSKVGLYLHNGNPYLEAQYAVFKTRACPVNVNYRYKAQELVYLLDNADAEVVFFQACYAERITEIRDKLPKVRLYIQVADGTDAQVEDAHDFDEVIAGYAPAARIPRAADDLYMLYTGGTTGMPKGVMYPTGQFGQYLAAMGAGGRGLALPTSIDELREYIAAVTEQGSQSVSLPACPLMHGTGMWLGCFVALSSGGSVVTTSSLGLDPEQLLAMVSEHRVTDLVIVGDAFARPILDALDAAAAAGKPYDLSSLKQIASSGVMWSQEVKAGLLKHHDLILADVMGSSEGGMGSSITTRAGGVETAKFELNEGVVVITDDDQLVQPGSQEIGKIATSGFVPLGYYKDPEKSAATFREVGGVRYSFPGDYATVAADGSITLLGRGSACINTAGEKVFPEEVEEAVKRHEQVTDALVVGMPDPRFGQKVVAVAAATDGLTETELVAFCKDNLAGYKVPKAIVMVEHVQRAPNGKADYKWARATAEAHLL
ncbi:MAG: AMP-binding protein [Pseudomonadaceae bacterium]|nr:AMP-binding protein [Pseudomonadaceae bacterium]